MFDLSVKKNSFVSSYLDALKKKLSLTGLSSDFILTFHHTVVKNSRLVEFQGVSMVQ